MNPVRYEVRDGIAEIHLCHAPVNALDVGVLDALIGALEKANADAGVRALLLASSLPGRFCAGLDMKQLLQSTPAGVRELLTRLYTKLYDAQFNLTKPSISVVSGAVRGGGMTVAISSDMIVAADSATFGYPELDVGLLPAIHYTHLPRIVGRYRAFELLFTGRSFGVAEAMELGLISRAVPEAELMGEARKLAQVFARKSPQLMKLGKDAFVRATNNGYREGAAAAVDLVSTVFGTEDCKEGLAAFGEKRRPVWKQP